MTTEEFLSELASIFFPATVAAWFGAYVMLYQFKIISKRAPEAVTSKWHLIWRMLWGGPLIAGGAMTVVWLPVKAWIGWW